MDKDPADAFCAIYDRASRREILKNAERWRSEPGFRRFVERIRLAAENGTYRESPGRLEGPESWETAKIEYAHLVGLEQALDAVHPHRRLQPPTGVSRAEKRYRGTGDLSGGETAGILLPRFSAPLDRLPAATFSELFESLRRLDAQSAGKVNVRVHPDPAADSSYAGWEPADGLRLACIPFLGGDEVTCATHAFGSYETFHFDPIVSPDVEARVYRIVEKLDAVNVDIAIVPESCCSPSMMEIWRAALRSRSRRTNLRLLLPGTGNIGVTDTTGPVVDNIATILDGQTGDEVFRAFKQRPFRLPSDKRADYGFSEGALPLVEALTPVDDERLPVLELPIGRLGVLTCEDLAELPTFASRVADTGLSLILSPVLSRPAGGRYRWAERSAEPLVAKAGATVVVADSRIIADRTSTVGRIITSMVYNPLGKPVLQSTEQLDDLAIFDLRPGEPPQVPADSDGRCVDPVNRH